MNDHLKLIETLRERDKKEFGECPDFYTTSWLDKLAWVDEMEEEDLNFFYRYGEI